MTRDCGEFARALLDPAQPVPGGLVDAAARPAGRRFDVYRNNVAVSLTQAMHQAFPVVAKLIGAGNMDVLAGKFLQLHPPTSPLLMHYGRAFPAYLETAEQVSHLGYLPDVARLELAIRRSYHAADADPVARGAFELAPDALTGARLGLAPALQVQCSPWPIHAIWRFNTVPDAPRPLPEAQDVAITRPGFDPVPELLPPGGAAWIAAVRDHQTLGAAQDAALAAHPGFDLGAMLALLLRGNAIISVTTEG